MNQHIGSLGLKNLRLDSGEGGSGDAEDDFDAQFADDFADDGNFAANNVNFGGLHNEQSQSPDDQTGEDYEDGFDENYDDDQVQSERQDQFGDEEEDEEEYDGEGLDLN